VSGFNPLKILIPSAVALLVVFAAIFAFTRNSNSGSNINTNQQTLAADPNSQPVQAAQPATGKGEEGIPGGGVTNPATNVNANVNANANAGISPTPADDANPNINENANANANVNANSNQKAPALPEPTRSVVPENVPPPVPSSTKTPSEKPSPAASPSSSPE
jgi:hypothetical protein